MQARELVQLSSSCRPCHPPLGGLPTQGHTPQPPRVVALARGSARASRAQLTSWGLRCGRSVTKCNALHQAAIRWRAALRNRGAATGRQGNCRGTGRWCGRFLEADRKLLFRGARRKALTLRIGLEAARELGRLGGLIRLGGLAAAWRAAIRVAKQYGMGSARRG